MMYQKKYYTFTPGGVKPGMNCIVILIILNVLVFLFVPGTMRVWMAIGLNSDGIQHFKLWQLVTYMFLHANVMHILFNMYGLYLFGNYVLTRLGTRRFLILYFLSGISGAILWLLFNWGSMSPVIGASGAVFGIMMAAAMFFPNMRIMLLFPPIPMTLKTFVAVFAAIEIFSELSSMQGGVAHLAHLGGFLGAFVYIRMISGERMSDILKSPLKGFPLLGDLLRRRRSGPSRKPQSKTNQKTYKDIMLEIREIEEEEKRKRDDDFIQ
jgi:membrane associated rhomboid family serine protease